MSYKPQKSIMNNVKVWLPNLYYICTLITLFFIMAQVFFAKRTMIQSSEWEKTKMTVENYERFYERITNTALYGDMEALRISDNPWPDFTASNGWEVHDDLRYIFSKRFINSNDSLDYTKWQSEKEKILTIMDAFAYPIIMGYASEVGSCQLALKTFYTYGNFVIPFAIWDHFDLGHYTGYHATLLYRLWRVRYEQKFLNDFRLITKDRYIETLNEMKDNLLCFEEKEVTPASLIKYEKKLDKELKKIQKEIAVFRKNSLK